MCAPGHDEYASVLVHVETFADWSDSDITNRMRADAAAGVAVFLTLGAFVWWIVES